MSSPEIMRWKLLYYWVQAGKWRRWCIPGAIFGMVAIGLFPLFLLILKDYPNVEKIVKAIYFFLLQPVGFVFELDLYGSIIGLCIIFAWFAVIGAFAGAIVRILWQMIKRKPPSENCYILEKEKVEQE